MFILIINVLISLLLNKELNLLKFLQMYQNVIKILVQTKIREAYSKIHKDKNVKIVGR